MDTDTRTLVDTAKESLSPECCALVDRTVNAFPWVTPADLVALLAAEAEYYRDRCSGGLLREGRGTLPPKQQQPAITDDWIRTGQSDED